MSLENAPLGKKSAYVDRYDASLLFPITRKIKRDEINISESLPFHGYDLWNAYELSWLDMKGKPVVALARIIIPCDSENLIESKSLKLYFNSFNQTAFLNHQRVTETIEKDLSYAAKKPVAVVLISPEEILHPGRFDGIYLDTLDISINHYSPQPSVLMTENTVVTETIYSHLLKSNCLVTFQPDWGSVQIRYTGRKIQHESLLRYLIGFRQHNEFHEQCVERIFMDILRTCQPSSLTVYARYTRRGGLDINPYRSTEVVQLTEISNARLSRQ